MIEALPVKHVHIYIHNFQIPAECLPEERHLFRVQYGKINPSNGMFIEKKHSETVEL